MLEYSRNVYIQSEHGLEIVSCFTNRHCMKLSIVIKCSNKNANDKLWSALSVEF
jgi:hypothetical protein